MQLLPQPFALAWSVCTRSWPSQHYILPLYVEYRSGIGGGGFMTVRIPPAQPDASSEVFTIDFRETAPALSNKTMFPPHSNSSQFGGLSVGIPGEVRGLEEAHRRFVGLKAFVNIVHEACRWGSLPWKTLVEPSVALARGWTVQKELGQRITVRSLFTWDETPLTHSWFSGILASCWGIPTGVPCSRRVGRSYAKGMS